MLVVSNQWTVLLFVLGLGWEGNCDHIGIFMVQRCSRATAVATGTVGEDNSKQGTICEDIVDGEIVGEEVGYEETDFLDGISSTQETRKFVDLVVVSKVTKS